MTGIKYDVKSTTLMTTTISYKEVDFKVRITTDYEVEVKPAKRNMLGLQNWASTHNEDAGAFDFALRCLADDVKSMVEEHIEKYLYA